MVIGSNIIFPAKCFHATHYWILREHKWFIFIKATPVIINKDSKPKPKKQTIETVKTTTNGRSSPAGKQTEAAKTSQLLEKTAQLWGSEDSLSVCLEISQMFR